MTWGAGGSTRRKTTQITARIQNELGIRAMAHLSCVGSSRDQLAQTLDELMGEGIVNVLPLGGDRPKDYEPPPDSFDYANQLVEFIRERTPRDRVCLAGACYPEVHPRAESPEFDMRMLVQKVNAGVDFLITQLFFDNADYFAFVERAREAGIQVPIIPGIMPVISAANIDRITALCGARLPDELKEFLAESGEDDERTLEVGIDWATRQCRELLDHGATGIHFYTLNRSPATRRIYQGLFK